MAKNLEVGRSMVEMLGTLAIMGILSVVGLKGYHSTMDKYQANTLIQEAQKRAVIVAGQIGMNGHSPSLAEFAPYNATSSGTFGEVKTLGLANQFGIEVSGVKKRICENILQMIGESTPIRRLSKENTPTTPITSCDEENAFLFIYNNDMSPNDTIVLPKTCRKPSDCTTACATCEIPENEEVGICTNECEEPVRLCERDNDCNTENECMMCDTEAGLCKNGCERVEYLESSGTQYIDTGFIPNQNSKAELTFQHTTQSSVTTAGAIFGERGSNSFDRAFCLASDSGATTSSKFDIQFGNHVVGGDPNFDFNKHTIIIAKEGYWDGVLAYTSSDTFTGAYSCWLFGRQSTSSVTNPSKIYSCKIWDNDTLIRDFVPVIAPNGKACMLNRVPEEGKLKLYCDANGGTFRTNKDN